MKVPIDGYNCIDLDAPTLSVVSFCNRPQAGSFALLAMGAGGLLLWARRRKR